MNLFYLDYDTRKKRYFIAPMVQPKDQKWLVEFDTRSKADQFLKQMLMGKVNTPDLDSVNYVKVREEEEGLIVVYKPRPQ